MVTLSKASRMVLIGGYSGANDEYCDKIMELVKSNPMKWVILDQELESGRYGHVAYVIPDHLTSCKLLEEEYVAQSQNSRFKNIKKRARVFRDPYQNPMENHHECSQCPHTSLFGKYVLVIITLFRNKRFILDEVTSKGEENFYC